MIVKVKEPQATEISILRPDQILFTYLHLTAEPDQTQGLVDSCCIGIAYETVTDDCDGLPLLAPISEVAGRMSIQVRALCLEKIKGGKGVYCWVVCWACRWRKSWCLAVVSVGTNAARMARWAWRLQ